MSTTTDKAKKVLAIAGQALSALDAIGIATKGLLAAPGITNEAIAVIEGILAVITTVQQGIDGTVSVQSVEDALKALADGVASNNAAADAAANAKFGAPQP